MKFLFKFIVLLSFGLILASCGRMGDLIPYEGYVPLTKEMVTNASIKTNLEQLSDSELILKAIGSGNRDKIKFAGNQALDDQIPSYEKDLENREELIEALFESIKDNNLDSGEKTTSNY